MSDTSKTQIEKAGAQPPATVEAAIRNPIFLAQISEAFGSANVSAAEIKNALVLSSQKSPALLKCSIASFAKCVRDSATINLLPNGRDAHLVPFGADCTLVPDYKGLIKLALKSGKVKSITTAAVHANDEYEYGITSAGETFRHFLPKGFGDRGQLIGFYSRTILEDGTPLHEQMSFAEVEKIRAKSKSGGAGPWKDHFSEMGRKTVCKRQLKWIPVSPELALALAKDDEDFVDIDGATSPATRRQRNAPRLAFAKKPGDDAPAETPAEPTDETPVGEHNTEGA